MKSYKLHFKDTKRDFSEMARANDVLKVIETKLNNSLGHVKNNYCYFNYPTKDLVNRLYVMVYGVVPKIKVNFLEEKNIKSINIVHGNETLKLIFNLNQKLEYQNFEKLIALKKGQELVQVNYSNIKSTLSFSIENAFLDRIIEDNKKQKEKNLQDKQLQEKQERIDNPSPAKEQNYV